MNNFSKLSPIEMFQEYLKEVLIESRLLSPKEIKKIFLMALADFFENKIDIKALSVVASQIYFVYSKPHKIDLTVERNLARLLSDTAELDYYFDNAKENPINKKMYDLTIDGLRRYFEENKNIK